MSLLTLLALLAACHRPDGDGDPVVTPKETASTDTHSAVDSQPTDPVDTAQGDLRVTSSGPIPCAEPHLRDAAPFLPFDAPGAWSTQPFDDRSDSLFVGGGLGAADWTGDGLLDVMITSFTEQFRLWVGRPDLGFDDGTSRLPLMPERTTGITPVDVEGDGDLDAYVATFNGPSMLLLNDGTGTFTDVAAERGALGDTSHRWMASAWADVDRDGDLDGFIAAYGRLGSPTGLPPGDPSMLLIQQPDGTFIDHTPGYPADHPFQIAHTFLGSFNDIQGDGWPDLYLVNDFGWTTPSLLLMNVDGDFQVQDVGAESRKENMGLGVGDLNGDLIPDFLVTAWDAFQLFESGQGGAWFETSATRGLVPDLDGGQNVAWGNELADLDNDGDLDAWITIGQLEVRSTGTNPPDQPDAVFEQLDDGTFVDRAPAWGLADPARNRSVLLVDLNRDGWLDALRTDLRGPTDILLGVCGVDAWLEVELRQPGPNPYAIGARVTAWLSTQPAPITRDVRAGGTGYGSGGPPEVHLGLGDVPRIDRLEIRWPDLTVSELTDVIPRQRLLIERVIP